MPRKIKVNKITEVNKIINFFDESWQRANIPAIEKVIKMKDVINLSI